MISGARVHLSEQVRILNSVNSIWLGFVPSWIPQPGDKAFAYFNLHSLLLLCIGHRCELLVLEIDQNFLFKAAL